MRDNQRKRIGFVADYEEEDIGLTATMVHEDDPGVAYHLILDQWGNAIPVERDWVPFGFVGKGAYR